MLSKEEIEYIEELEKAIEDNKSFYWQEDMHELIEIIKKQNGREQKLIEKLEEDKKEHTYGDMEIDAIGNYVQEILQIYKKEK